MAKRPYTHGMYLRSKESRKKATEKWLSKPENKQKIRSFQRDYYRQRYQNDPEYRTQDRQYQKQYRLKARSNLVRFAEQIESQRSAHRRYKERQRLKSGNGDISKFFNRTNKMELLERQQKQRKELNRAKASFKAVIRNLKRKANLIAIYGPGCAMCGEDNGTPLHLHHINGDGGRERAEHSFRQIFSEAIAYPNSAKYQLLCQTCHREAHRWLYFFDHRA